MPHDISTFDDLLADFQEQIGVILKAITGRHSAPELTCFTNLVGVVICLEFEWDTADGELDDLLQQIFNLTPDASSILSARLDQSEGCIWLTMGVGALQAIRVDRMPASRVFSMWDELPQASLRRPQTVCLRPYSSRNPDYSTKFKYGSPTAASMIQDLVYLLRTSLRLHPIDLTTAIKALIEYKMVDIHTGKIAMEELATHRSTASHLMQAVTACIQHAVAHGYLEDLRKAFQRTEIFASIDEILSVSAIQRTIVGTWPVMFHASGKSFLQASQSLAPSYFVDGDSHFLPHIHIFTGTLGDCRLPHIMFFPDRPSPESLERAKLVICKHLNLPLSTRFICTEPNFQATGDDPMFRADGNPHAWFSNMDLSHRLRDAVAKSKSCTLPPLQRLQPGDCDTRSAMTVIIWARQSRRSRYQGSSLIRQVWSTLSDLPFELQSLSSRDTFIVAVEQCSSHQHSWAERTLWKTLGNLPNQPTYVLTANPDRLTRRNNEIKQLIQFFKATGGGWYTRGFNLGETTPADWQCLNNEDLLEPLESRTTSGRHKAHQLGFYSNCSRAMTRVLASSAFAPLPQIDALHKVLELFCRRHSITRILICYRVSPTYRLAEDDPVSTTLVRQLEFLQLVIPPSFTGEILSLKGNLVSAFNDAFTEQIAVKLKGHDGNTLVIGSSPDRISRRADAALCLSRRQFGRGDSMHFFMSFLWDCETVVDPVEALVLPADCIDAPEVTTWRNELDEQRRIKLNSPFLLPIIQPIVWTYSGLESPAEYALRALRKAEEWCHSIKLAAFQGDPSIAMPEELIRDDGGRGFDLEHQQKWQTYLRQQSGIKQLTVRFVNANAAWKCSCSLKAFHDQDCPCPCIFCRAQRSCPCPKAACECPYLCNCTCEQCHTPSGHRTGTGTRASKESQPAVFRKCKTTGCEREAPSNGYGGVYCTRCYNNIRKDRRAKGAAIVAPIIPEPGTLPAELMAVYDWRGGPARPLSPVLDDSHIQSALAAGLVPYETPDPELLRESAVYEDGRLRITDYTCPFEMPNPLLIGNVNTNRAVGEASGVFVKTEDKPEEAQAFDVPLLTNVLSTRASDVVSSRIVSPHVTDAGQSDDEAGGTAATEDDQPVTRALRRRTTQQLQPYSVDRAIYKRQRRDWEDD